MNVTCIIPFYNEADRLKSVIEQALKCNTFDELLCVDDGSTDEGFLQVQHLDSPKLRLIRHETNQGKAAAMLTGAQAAKGEHVFFLDADLVGLNSDELDYAVTKYFEHLPCMIVLRRQKAPIFAKITRNDVFATGERILSKAAFLDAMKTNPQRYEIEMAINKYAVEHELPIYWTPSHGKSTYKYKKLGFKQGIRKEFAMYKQMAQVGKKFYVWCWLFLKINRA